MTVYSGSWYIYQLTNGTPALDFRTTPYNSPRVFELGAQVGTAAVTIFGIGRAANSGTTVPPIQLGPQAMFAEDGSDKTSLTTAAVVWSVQPTAPVVYQRRLQVSGAAIGQSMILTFPRGLSIPPDTSLVFMNLTTTQALGSVIWGVIDE